MPHNDARLDRLQGQLGHRFLDIELLKQALVHRSWLNEAGDPSLISNERLEFLGDAALEAFVSAELFVSFPDASEGWLTQARSLLVRNESLAAIGRDLRLAECLQLGAGIARDGGAENDSVLSCTLEAVIGAVWLDGGDAAARAVIERLLGERLALIEQAAAFQDAKSKLQQLTQRRFGQQPTYRIIRQSGPDHERTFEAEVLLNGESLASGVGSSKQGAEMDAAAGALAALGD